MSRDRQNPRTAKPRHATVMFADISGFTAERLDPEEVIGIVNGCFERHLRPI